MTAQLSRERLEFYANNEPPFGYTGGDIQVMARMLLAGIDSDKNARIAESLESLIWPNMAIGNKVIIKAAIDALRAAPPAPVAVPSGYRLQPISEYDAMCAAMLNTGPVTEAKVPEGWIKCSDRMPAEYDRNIWLWNGSGVPKNGFVWDGYNFVDWNEEYLELSDVTHWMPMRVPTAPEQE